MVKNIYAETIWISDLHIGSNGCQKEKITHFLCSLNCKRVFLNGDIIDKFVLKNDVDITQDECVRSLIELQDKCEVTVLPGNHDSKEDLEKIFTKSQVIDEIVFTTKDNKRLLVFHGDKCDPSIKMRGQYIMVLGTRLYEFLLKFKKKTSGKHSVSRFFKRFIKLIIWVVFSYEKRLVNYIKTKECTGVICGHSHNPIVKKMAGIDFINSGDWIDNCSYVVEDSKGNITLQFWK